MLKAEEVRALSKDEKAKRLAELQRELMQERGVQAMGGSSRNPGKVRTLRREIARILTIQRELQLGLKRGASK